MPQPIEKFYLEGASVDQIRDYLNEYPSARMTVLMDGKKGWIRVTNLSGHGGGTVNESWPCPGSPGCG